MAHDGLLPRGAAKIHPQLGTPYVATIFTGLLVAVLAALLPIGFLAELVSIGTLFAFAVVCLGVLVLRITQPNLHRPFRAPAIWLVAPAGVGISVLLMLVLPLDTWIRLAVWLVIGLLIYFSYGARRSRLRMRSSVGKRQKIRPRNLPRSFSLKTPIAAFCRPEGR